MMVQGHIAVRATGAGVECQFSLVEELPCEAGRRALLKPETTCETMRYIDYLNRMGNIGRMEEENYGLYCSHAIISMYVYYIFMVHRVATRCNAVHRNHKMTINPPFDASQATSKLRAKLWAVASRDVSRTIKPMNP